MVKIEKKHQAVQRIRQENGLDKYSPARVMPMFSELPWSSPNQGSWPAVGAHNFASWAGGFSPAQSVAFLGIHGVNGSVQGGSRVA